MMIINPLPNSNPLTNDWFERGLKEFEDAIKERIVDCEENNDKNKNKRKLTTTNGFCGNCCLELFYFRDNSYKNAIWIKVFNLNGLNIWIRVGIYDTLKKKVNVFSECDLDCIDLTFVEKYALPPYFNNNGIWMSDKGSRASDIIFDVIIQQICNLLPCLCNAKCKV